MKIANSNANGSGPFENEGGGAWIIGNLQLKDCVMENNTATGAGSAIFVSSNGKLTMASTKIITADNQANWIWMESNSVLSVSDTNEIIKQ